MPSSTASSAPAIMRTRSSASGPSLDLTVVIGAVAITGELARTTGTFIDGVLTRLRAKSLSSSAISTSAAASSASGGANMSTGSSLGRAFFSAGAAFVVDDGGGGANHYG